MSGLARRLITNTLFNFLGRFVSRLANFFLVPYILWRLGIKDFGLFSLLNVCFYFASLADLGMGESMVRFMATDIAAKDYRTLGQRVLGLLLFFFGVTLTLTLFLQYFGDFLLRFFSLGAGDSARLHGLVVAFIVSMGLGFLSNVFQGVLLGHQRMDWTNAMNMLLVIPNVVGTIVLLEAGHGLEGVVWVFLLVQGLRVFFFFWGSGKVCPQLRWARAWPQKDGFLQTLRLGLQVQWVRVVSTLSRTLDQALLAPLVGLTAVTTYALASKPIFLAQEVGTLLLSATVPMVAQLDSLKDHRRMGKLLRLSQRYLNLFVVAAIAGFWLFSDLFVELWLGAEYLHVAEVMPILAIGHLVGLLLTPAVNDLLGRGNMKILLPILTAQTLMHVGLTWWLTRTMGVMGPAIALGLASAYGTTHAMFVFYRSRRGLEGSPAAPQRELVG